MLVVDRNELEGQLSGWVERLVGEEQSRDINVEYATNKARLQELLDQDFRGLIISMIHKFDGIRKDYVIVHELVHLKVPNHGKLFTSLLSAHLPGYKYGAKPEAKSRSL